MFWAIFGQTFSVAPLMDMFETFMQDIKPMNRLLACQTLPSNIYPLIATICIAGIFTLVYTLVYTMTGNVSDGNIPCLLLLIKHNTTPV